MKLVYGAVSVSWESKHMHKYLIGPMVVVKNAFSPHTLHVYITIFVSNEFACTWVITCVNFRFSAVPFTSAPCHKNARNRPGPRRSTRTRSSWSSTTHWPGRKRSSFPRMETRSPGTTADQRYTMLHTWATLGKFHLSWVLKWKFLYQCRCQILNYMTFFLP